MFAPASFSGLHRNDVIVYTAVIKTPAPVEDVIEAYKEFYADAAFTH